MAAMFERELADIARRQHGLILVDQALAAGVTGRMIEGRVARGELVRVARRLVRVAAMPMTFEQRALGACLLAGPDAAASHGTAAVLEELAGARPGRIEISIPQIRSYRSPIAVVHRPTHPARPVRINGIPVTPVARTIVDIAARLPVRLLAETVDNALVRKLSSPDLVRQALIEASWGEWHAGASRLRDVLEVWTPGPLPGSVPEIQLARMIVAAGFPVPDRQIEICDAAGRFVARGDLGYPSRRVVLEYEGTGGHGPRTVVADRRRANAITAAGWTLLTATAATLGRDRRAFLAALAAVVPRSRRAA